MTVAIHQPANPSIGTLIVRARTKVERSPIRRAPGTPIRVLVADDSYLIREAMREVLGGLDQIKLVDTVADGDSLRKAIEANPPEIVITDIGMSPSGDAEGIEIARQMRETHPAVGVIVLGHDVGPGHALALFEDGAEGRGYLLRERVRDRDDLLAAIEVVAQGGTTIDPSLVPELLAADRMRDSPLDHLTPRESEVLAKMAEGWSNASIAESLVLTKRAVEKHVGAIFQKLCLEDDVEVSRRVTAVLMYLAASDRYQSGSLPRSTSWPQTLASGMDYPGGQGHRSVPEMGRLYRLLAAANEA